MVLIKGRVLVGGAGRDRALGRAIACQKPVRGKEEGLFREQREDPRRDE